MCLFFQFLLIRQAQTQYAQMFCIVSWFRDFRFQSSYGGAIWWLLFWKSSGSRIFPSLAWFWWKLFLFAGRTLFLLLLTLELQIGRAKGRNEQRRSEAEPVNLRRKRRACVRACQRVRGSEGTRRCSPVLSAWSAAPQAAWAAGYGSWRTQRTAAPGRSTPRWRERKWRPERTPCTSTCCWTSVWKVGCNNKHLQVGFYWLQMTDNIIELMANSQYLNKAPPPHPTPPYS